MKLAEKVINMYEADELWDVYFKRDGKFQKFNKKPVSMADAEDLMKDIRKAKMPSVDSKSGITVKAGTKPPKG